MPDYRSLIAPFIDFRRAFIKTDSTIRKDTNALTQSIDFFEQGNFDAPNEEYFSALEAHFLQRFKQSTTDSKISLTRKFFTWTQKGDGHMQEDIQITNPEQSDGITENREESNEEAHIVNFTEENEDILEDKADASNEPDNPPSHATVDADTKKPMPPQKKIEGAGLDTEHKSYKQIKITVYPDKALEADIRDLAALEGMPVSKFILTLIQQEVNNRRDDLNVIRRLRAKKNITV